MPLTDQQSSQIYTEAFQRITKGMLGEQSFAYADLKAQFELANLQMGVLRDELKATQSERDEFKAKWEGSTEGQAAALVADEAAAPPAA